MLKKEKLELTGDKDDSTIITTPVPQFVERAYDTTFLKVRERQSLFFKGFKFSTQFIALYGDKLQVQVLDDDGTWYFGKGQSHNLYMRANPRNCKCHISIQDIQLNMQNGMTIEQIQEMGMAGEAFIDRYCDIVVNCNCKEPHALHRIKEK